jgi:hypothetical protein
MPRIIPAVACMTIFIAPVQAGPPRFSTAVFPVEGKVTDVVPADFNGDGLRDFAVASRSTVRLLSFFIQTPDGFSFRPRTILRADRGEMAYEIKDLLGDDRPELAVLTERGVHYKTWSGDSGFTGETPLVLTQTVLPLPDEERLVRWMFVRDVDSDGFPDLIIPKTHWMEIHSGNGHGAFPSCRRLWVPPEADIEASGNTLAYSIRLPRLEVSDFNGDGTPDLLFIRKNRLDVFLQHSPAAGDGGALLPPDLRFTFETGGGNAFFLQTADFNGDGRADAAAIDDNRSARIHLNKGGRFDPVPDRVWSARGISFGAAVRDFNRDGLADIAFIELGIGLKSLTQFLFFQKYQRVLACTYGRCGDSAPAGPDFTMKFGQKFKLTDPMGKTAFLSFDGDFNGDGIDDMAVGSSPSTIEFHWGLPEGGFMKKAGAEVRASGSKHRIEDMNGDGVSDVFFWHPENDGVLLVLSRDNG